MNGSRQRAKESAGLLCFCRVRPEGLAYFFLQPPFLPFHLLFLSHFPRFFTKEKWPKELCCIIRCRQAKIFTVPFPWISLNEIMTDYENESEEDLLSANEAYLESTTFTYTKKANQP